MEVFPCADKEFFSRTNYTKVLGSDFSLPLIIELEKEEKFFAASDHDQQPNPLQLFCQGPT